MATRTLRSAYPSPLESTPSEPIDSGIIYLYNQNSVGVLAIRFKGNLNNAVQYLRKMG